MKVKYLFGRSVGATREKLADTKKKVDEKRKIKTGAVNTFEDRKERNSEDID